MNRLEHDPLDPFFSPLREARLAVDVRASVRARIAALPAGSARDEALPIVVGVAAQTLALGAVGVAALLAGAGAGAPAVVRACAILAGRAGEAADAMLRAAVTLAAALGRGAAAAIASLPAPSGAVTWNVLTLAAGLALAAVVVAAAAALTRDLSRPSPPWRTHA